MQRIKLILILSIIIVFYQCSVSLAEKSSMGLGVSYMYANINDKNFDYVDKYEMVKSPKDQLKNISLSSSVFYDNGFNIAFSTNRLVKNKVKRTVKRKADGIIFQSETEIKIDSVNILYKIKKFNLGIILANVGISKYLFYQGKIVGYENKHAILPGLSLGYFAHRNFIPSINYILPNKELNLEGVLSANINYLF